MTPKGEVDEAAKLVAKGSTTPFRFPHIYSSGRIPLAPQSSPRAGNGRGRRNGKQPVWFTRQPHGGEQCTSESQWRDYCRDRARNNNCHSPTSRRSAGRLVESQGAGNRGLGRPAVALRKIPSLECTCETARPRHADRPSLMLSATASMSHHLVGQTPPVPTVLPAPRMDSAMPH
jgi:hypothetical protein